MVKIMENPIKIWLIWGYHYFWKPPYKPYIVCIYGCFLKCWYPTTGIHVLLSILQAGHPWTQIYPENQHLVDIGQRHLLRVGQISLETRFFWVAQKSKFFPEGFSEFPMKKWCASPILGGFLKWWETPQQLFVCFPTKKWPFFGVWNGGYHHFRDETPI